MRSLKEIAARSVLTEKQLEKLEKVILGQGPYTREAVREELDWFCAGLGMNDYYFRTTPLRTMADHIRAMVELIPAPLLSQEVALRLQTVKKALGNYW